MEVKLISVEISRRKYILITSAFLPSIIAIPKHLCFPLGWKFCIDPLVGEAKLSMRLQEKSNCNYWNYQDGQISEKSEILVNHWCVFLSTILLPNESVRRHMHAAIAVNS